MTGPILAGLLVAVAVLVVPGGRRGAEAAGEPAAAEGVGLSRLAGAPGSPECAASAGAVDAGSAGSVLVGSADAQTELTPTEDDAAAALVLLALGYRSGLPTWGVLGAVADVVADPDPAECSAVARDLRQVAAALRWGASDDEAWTSVGAVWSGAARAVAIAHRAGIPPGPLLLAAADDLRKASLERTELAAARVGVKLVAPLGLVLLPAFCLTTVVPLVLALGRQLLTG
ncbi:type II secretion system F family protein [Intrasporangium calvum]|uniref:Type II secretion system F family protein n=1 Tax=Intrasporangium calvum TaxID=53358 RepID=A0ABT5GIW5_9MICO|nr:type II secretion system F family protein [Intrasporangium calvum]MDC5698188.1 type II secretion system F family protein [Intrasporangium calvum]